MCISFCAERGHDYAGIQYSEEVRRLAVSSENAPPLPDIPGGWRVIELGAVVWCIVENIPGRRFSCDHAFAASRF